MSLFELPVSKGARIARVASILALNGVLVVAGIAMIMSYMKARDRYRAPTPTLDAGAASARVEVLPPQVIGPLGAAKSTSATATGATPPRVATAGGGARPASTSKPVRPRPARSGTKKPRVRGGAKPGRTKGGPQTPPTAPRLVDAGTQAHPPATPATGWDPGTDPGINPTPDPTEVPADAAPAAPPTNGPSEQEITVLANRIGLVVNRKRSQLQRCYSQAAKASTPDDPLEGKVVIRFEVMPSGKARNVRPSTNTTGSPQLARCLQLLVQSWSFPPSSQPIEFAWPFVFKAPT